MIGSTPVRVEAQRLELAPVVFRDAERQVGAIRRASPARWRPAGSIRASPASKGAKKCAGVTLW